MIIALILLVISLGCIIKAVTKRDKNCVGLCESSCYFITASFMDMDNFFFFGILIQTMSITDTLIGSTTFSWSSSGFSFDQMSYIVHRLRCVQ